MTEKEAILKIFKINRAILATLLRGSVITFLLVGVFVVGVSAQTHTTSATDGTTPLGITPGSPSGSYALSGFDSINPYNGNLNFRLPLLQIGGRGGAQMTMMLALNTKSWHVKHSSQTVGGQPVDSYAPSDVNWNTVDVGYGPGVLIGRPSGVGTWSCGGHPKLYVNTLTRLTFKTPDGTEYELRDQSTNGQPLPLPSCTDIGPSRGTVFVSSDGSAMTFISDSPISDVAVPQGLGGLTFPSGLLMLRDGTRYRIDAGLVSWLRDRNGNQLTFTYIDGRVSVITDSLNRKVTINYKVLDVSPFDSFGKCDQIIFRGFENAQRIIRIFKYNALDTALRSDYQSAGVQTLHQLFPELDGSDSTLENPKVVTAIYMPDGNLHYQFLYNPFGELARVVLPTGGAVEYDTRGDQPAATHSGVITPSGDSDFEIYRRVTERRVKPDGTTLEGKTVFTSTYSGFLDLAPWQTTSTIDHIAGDQITLLAREKHYFNGSPTNSLVLVQSLPAYLYPAWNEGREYQTDQFDSNGTTLLRSTTNAFLQRIPAGQSVAVLWWSSWATQFHLDAAREPANDPRLTDNVSSLTDTSPNLMAQQHFEYDQYNNRIDVYEYDFGSGAVGSLVRRSHTDYVTTISGSNYASDASIHIRDLPSEQWVSADAAGTNKKARSTYEYDSYTTGLTDRSDITGHGRTSSPTTHTTSYITRGNVTQITKWVLGSPDVGLSTRMQYDIAGNVLSVTDPNTKTTAFDFSDAYGYANSDALGNETPLPVELVLPSTVHTYALATKVTNALSQTTYMQFDYYLSRPVNGQDANGIVSKGRYDDSLDRPTGVDAGIFANSQLQRHTSFVYNDSSHVVTTQSDQTTLNVGVLTSTAVYDGLGRTTETRTVVPEGTIIQSKLEFDGMGRVKSTYNPYRTGDDDTYGVTNTTYDALGRILTITTPDSAVVTTTYSSNSTTVTDQATKPRRSIVDGLGRLIRVDEPNSVGSLGVSVPNQPTSYVYDVLDNLAKVSQGGQSRYFMYDSLKRLIRARNPEQNINPALSPAITDPLTANSQWCVKYDYDLNSNLITKTDSRAIVTNYTYDAINRLSTRSYQSDPAATPPVSYFYDSQGLQPLPAGSPTFTRGSSTGRLVAMIYGTGNAGTYMGYDQMGQVNQSIQVTETQASGSPTPQAYGMTYGYNLAGEMTSEIYPSGRVLQTEYDTAGRIAGTKNQGAVSYYAGATSTDATNRIQYSPHGAISALKMGNTKWEHTAFNNRLQPKEIDLGASNGASDLLKLEYGYGTTANNGNLLTQKITAPLTLGGNLVLTQAYTYDWLNRLLTASESGSPSWTQTFDCDLYGNRAVRTGSYIPALNTGLTPLSTSQTDFTAFDPNTNRLSTIPTQASIQYDVGGNLKNDAAGVLMTYDAENRQTNFNSGVGQYYYDGDGRRVKKIDSTGTTVFVYSDSGKLIAEYTSGSPSGSGGTSYLTSDHLGSTRVVTNASGAVKARYDYLPYGEEIELSKGGRSGVTGYGGADSTKQKFTQKERDNESGLDYFLARYYSSAQGRFTSVDPYNPILDSETKKEFTRYLEQPQNWNRYVYVWNNPLKYIDPNGEKIYVVTYTTGNKDGDKEFERVANTYAEQIRNSEGYDPEKDQVILRGVRTKEDFEGVVMEANQQEKEFGKIEQVALVSHAGPEHGPVFEYGTPRQDQYYEPSKQLPKLWFNWSQTAEAKFFGCNTAVKFAQNFANAQHVPTWGFDNFSSISSSPNKKTKGYWLNPFYKGPLYMVRIDGRGMVRRR